MIKTTESIIKNVESSGYVYIYNYMHKKYRKVIIQDKFGYKYDIRLDNLLYGQTPRFVDKSNPFSLNNISLWLKLNNSQFELLENNEYKGSDSKLNLYCGICKDYPKMNWNNLLTGEGCGVCSGKQMGLYHNLETQRPDLAKEWHPTLNGDLTSKDISYGSGKKVWWLCPNGHEYYSSINHRTNLGSGCKKCSNEKQESYVANGLKSFVLKQYNSTSEYSVFVNPKTKYPLRYDVYIYGGDILEINGIYIEVHGLQHYRLDNWHNLQAVKNKTSPEEEFEYQKYKDRLKKDFAKKNGTYVEIDLRKIKTLEEAIDFLKNEIKLDP